MSAAEKGASGKDEKPKKAPAAKAAKPARKPATKKAASGGIAHWDGSKAGSVKLDGEALGEATKPRLLREVVRMYEANRRQGTVKTKSRGETAYTTRKPYRQKGTGNARRGDFNSPLLRGGGVIFGPRPRDFGYRVPRRALREALRSALSGKLRDGEICSLKGAGFTAPSTKTAAAALAGLECTGSTVVVLPGDNAMIWKSFRNIPRVSVVRAADLNAYHVLAHDRMLLVDDAWDVVMSRLPARSPAEKDAS
ncbi:MAG: 50S ribosomal protein L4 [Planctomycetota bacterium]|jgi:large subunit ribosomal protein L4